MSPAVIAAHRVLPPAAPPGVIGLHELDNPGASELVQLDPDGATHELGPGTDARALPDGTLVFVRGSFTDERALVHVRADGSSELTPGGAGRLPAIGGAFPASTGPFSADGRQQARLRGACADDDGPCRIAIYREDAVFAREPVASVPAPAMPAFARVWMALAEDGSEVLACYEEHERRHLLRYRVGGSAEDRLVDGRCRAADAALDHVLIDGGEGLGLVDRSGSVQAIASSLDPWAVAIGPCATSIFVLGSRAGERDMRLDRIDVPSGTFTTLLAMEGVIEDDASLDLDARGWALVSLADAAQDHVTRAWMLPIDGSQPPRPLTLPDRSYEVTLGPSVR